MSTRSSARNLFPPLDNPELTIRRRPRSDPTLLNNSEMAAEGPGDLPVYDLRTMEELCQPSLKGRGDPIAPIAIQETNFGLKNDMIQQSIKVNGVTDDALRLYLFSHSLTHHSIACFDRLPRNSINTFEQMAKMFLGKYFLPSMVTKLRNKITNFHQRPDESLFEAWECYKLSNDRCPNHNMLPVTKIDTFYNGLTLRYRDTINAAAGGTFVKRRPKECYDLIEKMIAHHNDWDTSAQRGESSSSITFSSDTEIAALKSEMAEINKNLMRVLQVNKQVKAITLNCETCGGPHSFSNCPATIGNTQNVYAVGAYQVVSSIIEPVASQVSTPRPNQRPSISFADALILMPKFSPSIKSLLTNKDKLCELARTLLNEHCSVVLLKKFPEKLGDPGKFLIPCDFPKMAECLALADLGLANHSISHPVGVAEDVFVKVGTFHFPADFVVVDFDVDPRVPLIIRRSFLKTGRALIDVFEGELTLHVGKEAITFNLEQTLRYSANYNDMTANHIDVIDMACEEYSQEVLGFYDLITSGNPTSYYDPIVSTTSSTLTSFGNSDFFLEEVDAFLALENDPTSPKVDQSYVDSEGDILLLEAFLNDDPSLPPPNQGNYLPDVELKDLPPHLEYAFMEGADKLLVIITKDLSMEEKTALITVLKSHKRSIAWKLFDIKGIDPESCTHKILMELDFEPVVQHQRRVNLKIYDVIKNEVLKLLDVGLIYPISDSPWVSPVHCVPKKGCFTVVENEENVLIPTRLVTGWREKTTFTCPYRTFAYRHMPFGLCNAPGTFQRCMMAIFHDMIEKTMKVFMDDFSLFGNSFQSCLSHLEKMLKRCEDTNLCLNWEKSHFMVQEGIVLGHKISKEGIKVDKDKVKIITKLPHPTNVKGIRSFLGHAGFYRSLSNTQTKLTEAPILIAPDWDMPFELMCDASNFVIGAVPGQRQKKHFRPIHYAKGAKNLATDHLSRLENPHQNVIDPKEINESFPLETLNLVSTRGIDFMGPFSSSRGNKYILVAVDYLSKWVEAKVLPTNDARVVCKFLKNLFARFRTPRAIISDRGTHFCNDQFAKVMLKFDVTHHLATTYHPQISSQVEVSNRGLKRILKRTVGENRVSWSDKLDDALWAF
nr:reverse transcriptase domain-containing protein [Tanacetum cinerariifolium]